MAHRRLFIALLAGCGLAALATAALADPPSRVGRVSDVEGQVSFLPPDTQDWDDALRNYPVTAGESFWTGDDGRVELQLGSVQARVDSQTELDVVDLDYGDTRLSIPQGSVDVRLWRVPDGGVTIATPAGDVQLNEPGAYRIDVGAPDESGDYPPVEVTTLEGGDAGAPGPGGFVSVPAGAAAVIYAGYDPQLQDAQDADIDDWARGRESQLRYDQANWNEDREAGYADLADYGQFTQDPTYGEVWYPSDVPPDWAPYRFGQWSYVEPWGWTWIDDAPWGFTPFHYGRWVEVDGRWGWTPGRRAQRPVYAPALVAFIGGLAGGDFAWAPLAPDEPYIPSYEVSDEYVRQVNVANVSASVLGAVSAGNRATLAAGRLKNAAAISAIPAGAAGRGGKVQQSVVHVTPQALAQAQVAPGAELAAPPKTGARTGAGGLHAAPPPPAKVQQLRAAVAHAPKGSTAPPPIPGVHKAAVAPPAGAAARPIAPAAASGRQPPPKPLAPRSNAVTGAPTPPPKPLAPRSNAVTGAPTPPPRPRQPLQAGPPPTGPAPEARTLRRSPAPTPPTAAHPTPSTTRPAETNPSVTTQGGAAPKARVQTAPTTSSPPPHQVQERRAPPQETAPAHPAPPPKAPAAEQSAKPAPAGPPPKKPPPKKGDEQDSHAPS